MTQDQAKAITELMALGLKSHPENFRAVAQMEQVLMQEVQKEEKKKEDKNK